VVKLQNQTDSALNKDQKNPDLQSEVLTDFILRESPCQLCGSREATIISPVRFWDLQDANIVRCLQCFHAQLDPMISEQINDLGCTAYYMFERSNSNSRENFRNSLRSFRRGVAFAHQLKSQNIFPKKVLELGPGNGFFLAGMKYLMPDLQITVLDIVQEVLDSCKSRFGFSIILSTTHDMSNATSEKLDLIIARDVIEHLTHIDLSIEHIARCLNPGGHFHFITPLGITDYWVFHTTWKMKNQRSELLINHLNYFEGVSLKNFLAKQNLFPVQYYGFGLKSLRQGRGWKKNYEAPLSPGGTTSAQGTIDRFLNHASEKSTSAKSEDGLPEVKDILALWPMSLGSPMITAMYCSFKQNTFPKIPAERNVGEEIFGLFQLRK
jgi:2-polyprenyl-3-methyl-5-hydroxy-6-metoxy-1,4-benzoquinol methylase